MGWWYGDTINNTENMGWWYDHVITCKECLEFLNESPTPRTSYMLLYPGYLVALLKLSVAVVEGTPYHCN